RRPSPRKKWASRRCATESRERPRTSRSSWARANSGFFAAFASTEVGQRVALEVMKITYYLEVLSSWCHWVEPTWDALKARYAGRAEFEWKIALMNPADFPVSRGECDWFYRRSGATVMNSPYMLNSGWYEDA